MKSFPLLIVHTDYYQRRFLAKKCTTGFAFALIITAIVYITPFITCYSSGGKLFTIYLQCSGIKLHLNLKCHKLYSKINFSLKYWSKINMAFRLIKLLLSKVLMTKHKINLIHQLYKHLVVIRIVIRSLSSGT